MAGDERESHNIGQIKQTNTPEKDSKNRVNRKKVNKSERWKVV